MSLVASLLTLHSSSLGLPADLPAAYWPRFRGPLGTGYAGQQQLPLRWGPSENVLWRTPLPGPGASSPVVWGGRVFLTASTDAGHKVHVLCLDFNTGRILWQRQAAEGEPGPTHAMNQHASATPATDGSRVYTSFGKLGVYCHDNDGNLVWERHLGDFLSVWGTASSPILYRDLVILCCDQDTVLDYDPPKDLPSKAFLIAMDRFTGETVWQTPRGASRGWSTPVVIRLEDGRDELVLNGPDGPKGYDPLTGQERWHCPREEKFGEPAVVPGHGLLFALTGRNGPLYAIRQGGAGDVTQTHLVWKQHRASRDLASPLVWEDYLYTIDNKGVGTCYEAQTGRVAWRQRLPGEYYASPVIASGLIYLLNRAGQTAVIEPGPELKVLARNGVVPDGQTEDFLASPALTAGRILLRSDRAAYCIGQASGR